MRNTSPNRPARRLRRGNPGLREEVHDPYRSRLKPRAPAACPDCGAIFLRGHWSWTAPVKPRRSDAVLCPACRRIKDHYPAGEVTIAGAFAIAHASEVLKLVDNVVRAESQEHPLNRVMGIHKDAKTIRIETTDVHLPRRIGHALEASWGGKLHTHYDEQGCFARVGWQRDD
jgi:hypothetical protein